MATNDIIDLDQLLEEYESGALDIDQDAKTAEEIELQNLSKYGYKPVADGVKGNEKLHKNCAWCPHKFECYKDSNNGEGLRIFQYSKGYAFLTKVVVEPKVQELDHEFKNLQEDTEAI